MLSTTTKFTDKKTSSKMKISTVIVFYLSITKKQLQYFLIVSFLWFHWEMQRLLWSFCYYTMYPTFEEMKTEKAMSVIAVLWRKLLLTAFWRTFFFNISRTRIIKKGYLKYYFEDTQNYKNLLHPRCSKFSWEHRENIK